MMNTMNTKEIALAIAEAYDKYGYTCFGVRTGRIAEIGEELEASHDWDHETDWYSDDLLPGTCSTGIRHLWYDGEEEDADEIGKAIALHEDCNYNGEMTYIIAGNGCEYGEDDGEMIIADAVVICIIR